MTDAGDKLRSAMERHRMSVDASRETAREIAAEREAALAAVAGSSDLAPDAATARADEGETA